MKEKRSVSISVIRRLPRYYRFLRDLLERGFSRISSRELSRLMKVTASQIRQDLNCFGGFGQQGYGYNVEVLHRELGDILGVNNETPAILIGVGNLGKAVAPAVASLVGSTKRGFRLVAAFEKDRRLVGTTVAGAPVYHIDRLEEFCQKNHPLTAVICVPGEAAAALADRLVSAGILGFWNFSSYDFAHHYQGIATVNVHLGDSLLTLSYLMTHLDEEGKQPNTLG